MPFQRPKSFDQICKHCGCTFGSHLGSSYYSDHYKKFFPAGTCPGNEGRMDWDRGPGTTFEGSGEYKDGNNVQARKLDS